MKNIYIVTSGDYSEYSIVCVFTSKKKAEKYVEIGNKQHRYEHFHLEEYTVDTEVPRVFYPVTYFIDGYYDTKTKEVIRSKTPKLKHGRPEVGTSGVRPARIHWDNNGKFFVGTAYGLTPELAEKNLWDAIAKAKAEREGL